MALMRATPAYSSAAPVLVIEDDAAVRFGIVATLRASSHHVVEAASIQEALALYERHRPEIVITDLRLPDGNALELLPQLRQLDPGVVMFVVTGYATIDTAVAAVKQGADDFLTKPVEMGRLLSLVDNTVARLATKRSAPRAIATPKLGTSTSRMRQLERQIERLRDTDCSVLILGETGTGKSTIARRIHRIGARSAGPFVEVNCSGLTREFVESELFGHERGAFTGAHASKPGLFEVASGGTLFLDEIGDIDPQVQPKLLKALEEKRFRRMGDVKERHVDVRLIAATHHDLLEAVTEKRFRADLYYRVSTFTLTMPALRERPEDVVSLARELLAARGNAEVELAPDAQDKLVEYTWPGNIRELKNVLERALLLRSGEQLRAADIHLDAKPSGLVRSRPLGDRGSPLLGPQARAATRDELEREHIRLALAEENGRVEAAAKRLGIPRSTLYQKLKLLGIAPSRSRGLRAVEGGPTNEGDD